MVRNFDYIDKDNYLTENIFMDTCSRIQRYVAQGVMDGFFSRAEEMPQSAIADESIIIHHQVEYIHLFLMMYLGYINKLVTSQLDESFGNDWREKNTGYIISAEGILMDDLIGTKKNMQDLLFGSGILHKTDEFRKARIVTQGEVILPAIQQKLGLILDLKSYFAVAQLHQKYIQVTLHQIIKMQSLEENASTIIIRDEMIPIENVYDNLCKNMWNNIILDGNINYCDSNRDNEDTTCDLYSLRNYVIILKKLNQFVSKIVSTKTMYFLGIL